MNVHAEAPEARHAVGEVELPVHLQLLLLIRGENAVEERAAVLRHHPSTVEGDQVTVDANGRRGARDDMEVRGARLDGAAQQIVDRGRRSVHEHPAYRQRRKRA